MAEGLQARELLGQRHAQLVSDHDRVDALGRRKLLGRDDALGVIA